MWDARLPAGWRGNAHLARSETRTNITKPTRLPLRPPPRGRAGTRARQISRRHSHEWRGHLASGAIPGRKGLNFSPRNAPVATASTAMTGPARIPKAPQSARTWPGSALGMARRPARSGENRHDNYFGATKTSFGQDGSFVRKDVANYYARAQSAAREVIAAVSARSAAQNTNRRRPARCVDHRSGRALIAETCAALMPSVSQKGRRRLSSGFDGLRSAERLVAFINNPAHPDFYGEHNDRMPSFGNELNEQSIGLIADWLRGCGYEPVGEASER